jgi:recombination associated protein RdgC
MAVISGALRFRRYKVSGKPAENPRTEYEDSIRTHAFTPFDKSDAREEATGWVCTDDWFDTELSPDRWFEENCIALTLRTDSRRVPSRVLRHECQELEKEWKARFDRERLTKAEREEIKDMKTKELVERVIPDCRGVDLYWDLERGEVFFFSGAEKANEIFRTTFEKCFSVTIRPLFPFSLAKEVLDEEEFKSAEGVHETSFIEGV